jgi:CubicO group peptidase (beta-lactamase class C family)
VFPARRHLSLEDPIGEHIPELANPVVFQDVDVLGEVITTPAKRCATVRELLTHTGGFRYDSTTRCGTLSSTLDVLHAQRWASTA